MKNLTNMKIRTRLVLGFTFILTLVALLGIISYYQGIKLWQNTDDLYTHPLQVARAVRDANADVMIMKMCVRDMIISDSANEIRIKKEIFLNHESNFDKNFDIVTRQYLGPKKDIDSIRLAYKKWKIKIDEIIPQITHEINTSLLKTMMTKGEDRLFEDLLRHIETVKAFSKDKADAFYINAGFEKNRLFMRLVIILILIIVISVIIGYLIIWSIRGPLKELTHVAEQYESGNYNARSLYQSKNEIGTLTKAFNSMASNVQMEINLKKNVADFAESIIENNELQTFCKNVLIILMEKTDAQVGAFYRLDESGLFFEHIESVGMDKSNIRPFSVESSEGQFGIALSTKKIHLIKNISSESAFAFPTISGKLLPSEIITIPIVDQNKVIAVISLSTIKQFDETALQLLNEITINLTARFIGVISFQKISEFIQILEENNHELELKRVELAKASQYNRSLIEANIDPLVTIGPDGKITDVNKATENVTGRTREQLIGSDFSDYFTDPENAKAGYKKVFSDGFVRDYELAIRHTDGKITPVFYNASTYKDENGKVIGVFAAARDITERKTTEQELINQYKQLEAQSEEMQAQAEELQSQSEELRVTTEELQEQNVRLAAKSIEVAEANRLKSEFLSNMSHELRTPLNSIMALSNVLIQRSKNKLSDEENSYLEIIERNGRNLLRLINDVLDLSKIEAGKIELSVKLINISTLLNNIQENIKPLADKKGLTISVDIPYDLPAIETDENRFQQIMTNIIGNAVKFTEKGGVSISAGSENSNIWIKVLDTGIGIPKRELSHIFDKFRQVDGSSSRSYEGTGLGLSIVNELVNIIGGEIQVESKLGEGSVFKLILPLKWKGEIKDHIYSSSASALIIPDKKTILVVDDDPKAVKEISTYLQESGFNTIGTSNAEEVVELAEKYRPFAITLDVIMPQIDGWEVLQRLKKNEKTQNLNVIIVSVSSDNETGLALGALAHITKPVDRDKLLYEIKRLHAGAVNIMVVDDNEIDRELIYEVLHNQGLIVTKVESGSQCMELISDNIPDVLVLDLMMPDIDGFQVLDFIRNNPKTKSMPVVIVTAKDLSDEDKEFLSGKASSILQKSVTKTNDVLKEIKRIINELESKFQAPAINNSDVKKTILIVEDNEEAIIQIKNVLESEGYEVDIAIGGEKAVEYFKTKIPDGIILDLMMPGMDGFEVLESMRSTAAYSQIPVLILTAKDLSQADLGRLSANNVHQLVQKGAVDIDILLSEIRSMTGQGTGVVVETFLDRKANRHRTVKRNKGKYNVLIVEDNHDNMTTIKAILGDEFKISEAYDGIEGLNKVLNELPDIILLDMSLPKMNGFEVLEEIRKNPEAEHIPVFAVTAKAMKHDIEAIDKAGFDGYISKPINSIELLDKIKKLLL